MRMHKYGHEVAIMHEVEPMHCATECPYECVYILKGVVMATVCSKCFSAVSRMASAAENARYATSVSDYKDLNCVLLLYYRRQSPKRSSSTVQNAPPAVESAL